MQYLCFKTHRYSAFIVFHRLKRRAKFSEVSVDDLECMLSIHVVEDASAGVTKSIFRPVTITRRTTFKLLETYISE